MFKNKKKKKKKDQNDSHKNADLYLAQMFIYTN